MNGLRIVSFLPSATEMVFALGLGDQLVGVSHECDYPPQAKEKPVVVGPALEFAAMSLGDIDTAVSSHLRDGKSLYAVDETLLQSLEPDLILTQNLCQVCATSGNEITQALKQLPKQARVLYQTPHSIREIMESIQVLADVAGVSQTGSNLIEQCKLRLDAIAAKVPRQGPPPRVFCCEWIDPVYCSGHWVPEMVTLAGGNDSISQQGKDSVRVPWEQIVEYAPEIFIVMPCGFVVEKAIEQTHSLASKCGWRDLPAVQNGRVYAVDANAYFARPGPRVVDGTELLAHLIHPEIFTWDGPKDAFAQVHT